MMRLNYVFVFVIALFVYNDAQGQILRRANEKVNAKFNQKIDQKIDEKIDEIFDRKIENKKKNQSLEKEGSDNEGYDSNEFDDVGDASSFGNIFGGKTVLRDDYEFNLGIDYTFTSINGAGKAEEPQKMTMWGSDFGYIANSVEGGEHTIVIDSKNNTMVMLQEENKTYTAINSEMIKKFGQMASQQVEEEESDYTFEKIGTETLLGYKCDVYKITDKDYVSKVWVTNELNFDYSEFVKSFGSMGEQTKIKFPNMKQNDTATLLKVVSKKTEDNEETEMVATKVHKDTKRIRMSEYSNN